MFLSQWPIGEDDDPIISGFGTVRSDKPEDEEVKEAEGEDAKGKGKEEKGKQGETKEAPWLAEVVGQSDSEEEEGGGNMFLERERKKGPLAMVGYRERYRCPCP